VIYEGVSVNEGNCLRSLIGCSTNSHIETVFEDNGNRDCEDLENDDVNINLRFTFYERFFYEIRNRYL